MIEYSVWRKTCFSGYIWRRFSGTMSINAAIFGSVLLASRLTSVEQVFGLVSCAVIFFALVPSIHRNVQVIIRGCGGGNRTCVFRKVSPACMFCLLSTLFL